MSVATTTAIAIGAGVSAAGAIGGSVLSAQGAGKQADAAMSAADLQHQDAQAALAFQEKEFNTQQKNIAPWLSAGTTAIKNLSNQVENGGFPDFTEQFQAPTGATEQNDPGYQFRLKEGMKALQDSAAARGDLFSGGTEKSLERYGQDYASNEYSNVYNRAMQQYQNRFNVFETNSTNRYNRLAGIAGSGQQAATTLGQEGQAAAGNVANINLTSGAQIGQDIQNAAAARASGYTALANGLGSAASGIGNNLTSYALLQQMGLV